MDYFLQVYERRNADKGLSALASVDIFPASSFIAYGQVQLHLPGLEDIRCKSLDAFYRFECSEGELEDVKRQLIKAEYMPYVNSLKSSAYLVLERIGDFDILSGSFNPDRDDFIMPRSYKGNWLYDCKLLSDCVTKEDIPSRYKIKLPKVDRLAIRRELLDMYLHTYPDVMSGIP